MANEMICRPWITLRNGKRLYAWEKGLKAFCFPANPDYEKQNPRKEVVSEIVEETNK